MVETERGLAERFIESAREAGFKDEKLEFLASSQSALRLLERRANELIAVDHSAPCTFMGVEALERRGARLLYDLSKAKITRVDGSCWNDSRTRVFESHRWGDVRLLYALVATGFQVPASWHRKPDGTLWFQHILFPNEISVDSKVIPTLINGSRGWSRGLISATQLHPNLWVLDVSDCIVAIA